MGDYAAWFEDGHVSTTVFERKSIGDLFSTMGTGYKRFKREMARAELNGTEIILIVEGTFSKVFKGYKHSKLIGISILRKLFTLWLKYGIVPVFCKDRKEMAEYIETYYYATNKRRMSQE